MAGQGTTLDDIFALMVGLNQRVGGIEADLAAVKAKRVSEAKEPALDSTPEKSAGPKGAAETQVAHLEKEETPEKAVGTKRAAEAEEQTEAEKKPRVDAGAVEE